MIAMRAITSYYNYARPGSTKFVHSCTAVVINLFVRRSIVAAFAHRSVRPSLPPAIPPLNGLQLFPFMALQQL